MPLFPTTFASPVVLRAAAASDGTTDVSADSPKPAHKDDYSMRTQRHYSQAEHVAVTGSNEGDAMVWAAPPAGSSPSLSPVVASSASSRRSSHHDRSSVASTSNSGASSLAVSRPSSYTSSLGSKSSALGASELGEAAQPRRKHRTTSPLVNQLARCPDGDRGVGLDDSTRLEPAAARPAAPPLAPLARPAGASSSSSSSRIAHKQNGLKPHHHPPTAVAATGLGFDMRGSNFHWSRDLVEIDDMARGANLTYSSDLGSGVSSQSSSPNTSPAAPAVHDPAVDGIRSQSRKQRAHFLEHQVEHHERSPHGSDRSPTVDLEPEHIVFDVPATVTRTARDRNNYRRRNNASMSSAASSSPALSASPATVHQHRRPSATSVRSMSVNEGNTSPARHSKVYFPPPPTHVSPRPAPVFSFLHRSAEKDEIKARLAANGPFPSRPNNADTAQNRQNTHSAPNMTKSRSASSFDKVPVFPSSPRVDSRRRYSALEPVITWDASDGDELDWMMEASARTVENHPARALMDHGHTHPASFGHLDADDDDPKDHDERERDVVDEVLGNIRAGSQDQDVGTPIDVAEPRYGVTPEAIAALAPVAQGVDKDVALQQWVLDQIASNAVGENWRRMSAIGEETDEEDEDREARPSRTTSNPRNVKGLTLGAPSLSDGSAKRVDDSALPVQPPHAPSSAGLQTPVSPAFALGLNASPMTVPRSPSSRPASITSQSSVRSRVSAKLTNLFGSTRSRSSASGHDALKPQGISSDSVQHLMASEEEVEELVMPSSSSSTDRNENSHSRARSSSSLRSQSSSPDNHQARQPSAEKQQFSKLLDKFQAEEQTRIKTIAFDKLKQRQEKLERRRGSLERADELMMLGDVSTTIKSRSNSVVMAFADPDVKELVVV
ncbi:hypothetical protein OIV83_005324 [Microbotryomycetes sp. JL201]|nr:hypothetical protein OIV83_005324 [Microbotryomycetes sp. JL201]